MEAVGPVLMPAWAALLAVLGAVVVLAWLLRSLLLTRRDPAQEAGAQEAGDGSRSMGAQDREQWNERLAQVASRWEAGELSLRDLHLELAVVLREFAQARSGQEVTTASVTEILDMADTAGPASVMDRLRRARREGRPLDTNPLGYVGELLAVWEQPSFGREPDRGSGTDPGASAQQALDQAGLVVSRW